MYLLVFSQMEFDEKDLRREISYAIKNIHGVRQVTWEVPHVLLPSTHVGPATFLVSGSEALTRFMGSFQHYLNILVSKDRVFVLVLYDHSGSLNYFVLWMKCID